MTRSQPAPVIEIEITEPSMTCAHDGCTWFGQFWPNRRSDRRYCRRHAPGSGCCVVCGSAEKWRGIGHTVHCARCTPEPTVPDQLRRAADERHGETAGQLRQIADLLEDLDRQEQAAAAPIQTAEAVRGAALAHRSAARERFRAFSRVRAAGSGTGSGAGFTMRAGAGAADREREHAALSRASEAADRRYDEADAAVATARRPLRQIQRMRAEITRQAALAIATAPRDEKPGLIDRVFRGK